MDNILSLPGDPIRPATAAEKAAGLHDDRLVQITDEDEPVELHLPGVKERTGGLWLHAIYRQAGGAYRIVGAMRGGVVCGQWIVSRAKQAAVVGEWAETLLRAQIRRASGVQT